MWLVIVPCRYGELLTNPCLWSLLPPPLPPVIPDPNAGRGHNVINVIIPESRTHNFFHHLGYVLATLLLFILLLILAVLVTHKLRRRGEWFAAFMHGF